MTPPVDDRLPELFERAIALSGEEREAFLVSESGGDETLLRRLRVLLAADEAASGNTAWDRNAAQNEAAIEEQAPDPAIGETIGAYRIVELIGKGGMGKVYSAVRVDAEFEQRVAIKRLGRAYDAGDVVARFRSERQILANLDHPNIARLLDGGAGPDGMPYLVMEHIEGIQPLAFCEQHSLPVRQRLILFRKICDAVHYAHQRMVVHRDLKPGNILVTLQGSPKLLDFGIAKVLAPESKDAAEAATRTGMYLMTARYASPEQVRGETVTTASDIYSLGVILYEMLTGHSPYSKLDRPVHELMTEVCQELPRNPSAWSRELRGDLDNIIMKALRKDAASRYSSVDQFSEDVQRYLDGRAVLARGDGFFYVAAKFIGRNRLAAAAASLVLLALVGGLIVVNRERALAERRFNDVRKLAHSLMFDYHDAIERLPGSTPVRARMVKDALGYLDSLSKEANTPELRKEIVDAYVRVSRVQGDDYQSNLGDTAGALKSARKAVTAAEKLVENDKSAEALMSAAGAFEVDASLLYSSGKLQESATQYRRAIDLRETVARQRPDDIDNGIDLSTSLEHLADLSGGYGFQNLGQTDEYARLCRRAAEIVGRLSARYPNNTRIAHQHYSALLASSAAERGLGHLDPSLMLLDGAIAEIEKITTANPLDVNAHIELANAEVRIGQTMLDSQRVEEALPHMARSATILEDLARADRQNVLLRRDLAVVETQWAAALRAGGDRKAALAHNRTALEIAVALNRADPKNADYITDVGVDRRKLAETMLASGDAAGAFLQATEAQSILCTEAIKTNAFLAANCGRAVVMAGNAEIKLNRAAAAVGEFRRGEQIASARCQADATNAIYRSDLARAQTGLGAALTRVGRFDDARTTLERALQNWSLLRDRGALTAEDAHRAADTASQLASLNAGVGPAAKRAR